MTFKVMHINKALIGTDGRLRFSTNKIDALRKLSSFKGHALGSIHDVPSYVTAVMKIYDADQQTAIAEFLVLCLNEGFKQHERDNLIPLLYDYDFNSEQVLVFLDLLSVFTTCETHGWIEQFRNKLCI